MKDQREKIPNQYFPASLFLSNEQPVGSEITTGAWG